MKLLEEVKILIIFYNIISARFGREMFQRSHKLYHSIPLFVLSTIATSQKSSTINWEKNHHIITIFFFFFFFSHLIYTKNHNVQAHVKFQIENMLSHTPTFWYTHDHLQTQKVADFNWAQWAAATTESTHAAKPVSTNRSVRLHKCRTIHTRGLIRLPRGHGRWLRWIAFRDSQRFLHLVRRPITKTTASKASKSKCHRICICNLIISCHWREQCRSIGLLKLEWWKFSMQTYVFCGFTIATHTNFSRPQKVKFATLNSRF